MGFLKLAYNECDGCGMEEVKAVHGYIRLNGDGSLTALDSAGQAAEAGSGLAAELVAAVLAGAAGGLSCTAGTLETVRTPLPAAGSGSAETAVPVDMTNLSVVVGGDKIVKLVRHWGGADRSARLLARLAEARVAVVPGYFGSLDWIHPTRGRGTIALVSAMVPDGSDGWTWAVDDVVAWFRGGTAPLWPATLGTLVAGVHCALLGAGQHSPPDASEVRDRTARVLEDALAVTGGAAGTRLANRAGHLAELLQSVPETAGPAFDLHGDLHLGQILRAGGTYWLLDFDGDPQLPAAERDRPDTAARDLAHLAASLDLVASAAAKRLQVSDQASLARLYGWAEEASVLMTDAYRDASSAAGKPGLLDESLLPPLIAEQLLRELLYAHRFLPRWQYAADGALTFRISRDHTRTKEPSWTPPAL